MVLDGKFSQEYPVNAGVPQGSIFVGTTISLLYINDLPDYVICGIAVYADDMPLYSRCDQAPDLWQQLESASELETLQDTTRHWTGAGGGFCISMLEELNWFRLTGLITLVLLM